MKPDV